MDGTDRSFKNMLNEKPAAKLKKKPKKKITSLAELRKVAENFKKEEK